MQSISQVFPRLWRSGVDQASTKGRGWKKTLRGMMGGWVSLDVIVHANKQTNKQTNKFELLPKENVTNLEWLRLHYTNHAVISACKSREVPTSMPWSTKDLQATWKFLKLNLRNTMSLAKNWAIVMSGVLAQCFRMFPSIRKQFAYSCSW